MIDIVGSTPQIPTTFETDSGNAVPIGNVLEILGTTVPAGSIPVETVGSGNTVTLEVQRGQAIAAPNAANVGLVAFDSADFTVDANGFVSLVGGGPAVLSVSGTANRITSTGGLNPVIDIAATYVGQASITTLGTITTGVWNGSVIPLAYGGTNANLTASNGGIFYSTATAGAILSGTATANQALLSGASTTPAWSTATYPPTTTINQVLYSSANNVIGGITASNNGVLTSSALGVPSWLAAGVTGQVLVATTGAPPSWATSPSSTTQDYRQVFLLGGM